MTASINPYALLGREQAVPMPAALSVFRIGDDGRLEFASQYPVETSEGQLQYWLGTIGVG